MKKYISTILFSLLVVLTGSFAVDTMAAGNQAVGVIDRAAAKLKSAKGITADYTMTSDGHSASGKITMSGDCFTINSQALKIWYDGTTQWSYSPARKEVNITEPTADELAQVNPYVIVNALKSNFDSRLLKSAAGTSRVELKARSSRSDIRQAVITVGKDNFPTAIDMVLSNGHKVNVKISNIKTLTAKPAVSTFRFNKKLAPGAEIVDLR